jgi:uroporphyrinogen decarboxylase
VLARQGSEPTQGCPGKKVLTINSRDRLLHTLSFKPTDRIPLVEWAVRKATMREWIRQGYPQDTAQSVFLNLDPFYLNVPISLGLDPSFEERILSQDRHYKIWQDTLGAIRKDFTREDNPGFVTRTWLKFPVEDRAGFLEIKQRYDSTTASRYPDNWQVRATMLNQAPVASHLSIPYLFWTARDWMGFENLCLAFYDQPELVDEMFTFLTDFIIETLTRGIDRLQLDMVELKEDMAYKMAPMISPELFRRFMLPHYRRLIDFLKGRGTRFVYVDCDGYPGGLIPLWLEAGIDGISPCEIAAGNDLLALRRAYPQLVLFGGIDKRVLTQSEPAIYTEVMGKVPQLIAQGGYIPHIDHAIPFDVPLHLYLYYRRLITALAHGENAPQPRLDG